MAVAVIFRRKCTDSRWNLATGMNRFRAVERGLLTGFFYPVHRPGKLLYHCELLVKFKLHRFIRIPYVRLSIWAAGLDTDHDIQLQPTTCPVRYHCMPLPLYQYIYLNLIYFTDFDTWLDSLHFTVVFDKILFAQKWICTRISARKRGCAHIWQRQRALLSGLAKNQK